MVRARLASSTSATLLAGVALGVLALGGRAAAPDHAPTPRDARIADDARASRFPELEALFSEGRAEEGLTRTEALLAAAPDDPELLIHQFRFLFERGEARARTDVSIDKRALYERMLAIAERGLALSPDHPRFLWGKGIATARLGTTKGLLASIRSASTIEGLWSRVIESGYRYQSLKGEEILPCDPMLALGMFYRMVPDWWIVEVIAGTRGDLDRSLALLERSNQCAPGRIRALKEQGVTELCIGARRDDARFVERGRATLRRAQGAGTARPVDRVDERHIAMLLADPSAACAYSRDGQLELDEEKLAR